MGQKSQKVIGHVSNLTVRMMPGQVPYTETELQLLFNLVGQAAMGDPGEENEKLERAVEIEGGTLYQRGSMVYVEWDIFGRETWTLPDTAWGIGQASENFNTMAERWSR